MSSGNKLDELDDPPSHRSGGTSGDIWNTPHVQFLLIVWDLDLPLRMLTQYWPCGNHLNPVEVWGKGKGSIDGYS